MNRGIAAPVVVGLLAYSFFLAALAPASALHWMLTPGAQIALHQAEGSLWRGRAQLTVNGVALGELRWRLAVASVLSLRPSAELALAGAHIEASGRVSHGLLRARTTVSGLRGDLALALLARVMHFERIVDTNIQLQAVGLTLMDGRVTDASGRVSLAAVTALRPRRYLLGDYVLDLAPLGDGLRFAVADARGPLGIAGNASWSPTGDWSVDVRLRDNSGDGALREVLQLIGEADNTGAYPLRMGGRLPDAR